jgi:hypothetical protein
MLETLIPLRFIKATGVVLNRIDGYCAGIKKPADAGLYGA